MQGKTVLVTGGNGGMGFATGKALAQKGATVVLLARSKERGEAAVKQIVDATSNKNVSLVQCDLSLLADVRRAADEFKSKHQQLHVLVNNAGVFLKQREVTSEGLEKTFATNYLSHFLLTHLLLDTMKASKPARIINIASKTGGMKIDFDDMMLEKGYSYISGMGRTKLAMQMMTAEMAKRLEGTGVTINVVHPGLVKTEILDEGPWIVRKLFGLMSASPEKGADTAIFLASDASVEGVTGKFYTSRKQIPLEGQATDAAACARLYDESLKLTGLQTAAKAA
jgi:NAD(P)-dependent dehydrogenase (short-subunit alcohol dehydrogenase family)